MRNFYLLFHFKNKKKKMVFAINCFFPGLLPDQIKHCGPHEQLQNIYKKMDLVTLVAPY
jgi:hypothetical protein